MQTEIEPEVSAQHSGGVIPPTHSALSENLAPKAKHARGLLAIGLFKLSKALFFFAVGMGALHLVHRNIGDVLLRVAAILHFDPDGQFVGMLQDKVDLISGHQLRQVSMLSILYGIVCVVEGAGLMLEKTWAEYLTLTLTIGALPIELFEIARNPTLAKFGVLFFNLLILAYLVWFLRKKRRNKIEESAEK